MKILQVVPFLSPEHGGSSTVPYHLSRELSKRGHEVTIFTSDYKVSQEWIESLHQVKVYPFKTMLSWAKFYVTPSIMKHVRKEIKHFDLIHMHNYRSFQNIVVHHYAKKHGVPYVLQAHGSLPRIMAKQKLKWIYDMFFEYRLLRDASKVIALTEMEAQQYRDMGSPEEKIEVIPNGIDLSEYNDLPERGAFKRKYGIGEGERLILYLGRIHKIKGIDLLIEAFAKLLKMLDDVKLVIAGSDDGYLSTCKGLVAQFGVEREVLFTGPLYGRKKLEAYVDADICVSPSRYEIFGITVLEACACGRPVIGTRVGGLQDIIAHRKTGLLVKPNDVKELSNALLNVLRHYGEAEEMGREATRFIASLFSIEKVVNKLEKLYEAAKIR